VSASSARQTFAPQFGMAVTDKFANSGLSDSELLYVAKQFFDTVTNTSSRASFTAAARKIGNACKNRPDVLSPDEFSLDHRQALHGLGVVLRPGQSEISRTSAHQSIKAIKAALDPLKTIAGTSTARKILGESKQKLTGEILAELSTFASILPDNTEKGPKEINQVLFAGTMIYLKRLAAQTSDPSKFVDEVERTFNALEKGKTVIPDVIMEALRNAITMNKGRKEGSIILLTDAIDERIKKRKNRAPFL
jgi:hypothetical protein